MPLGKQPDPAAKPSKEDVTKILEEQMPGWKLVETPRSETVGTRGAAADSVDLASPSLDQMKAKYSVTGSADGGVQDAEQNADRDTHVVNVESQGHQKSVGIRNNKIVWEQG